MFQKMGVSADAYSSTSRYDVRGSQKCSGLYGPEYFRTKLTAPEEALRLLPISRQPQPRFRVFKVFKEGSPAPRDAGVGRLTLHVLLIRLVAKQSDQEESD